MKQLTTTLWLGLLLAASSPAQNLQIASFNSNGRLTWTNACPGGGYTVQWASDLGSNTVWHQDWSSLLNLSPAATTTTVSVPMFYRVACLTNGFWPTPLGRTLTFSVSNAVGGVWTQQIQALGVLSVPSWTNQYTSMVQRDTLGGAGVRTVRSTDRALYIPTPDWAGEQMRWTNGPVGTSFGFTDESGPEVTTILSTTASITVPAGTYNNCLVFSNRCVSCAESTAYWIEYIKPGVGMVYWLDYGGVNNQPNVARLQSITGN